MIRKFLKDVRGNYMIATAIGIVPIMGAVALAVDFTEMTRERQAMLNALDAANLAAGRYLQTGADDDDVLAYARDFFDANLGPVKPSAATLNTILPNNNFGGGTLKSTGCLNYKPYFYPVFALLVSGDNGDKTIRLCAQSEVRLKNTLEVALVLDNSGSMNETGTGSGKKRLELLKTASKQLVDTIAAQAGMMKQVSKPVQFGIVPFSASVNVGPGNDNASWIDTDGLSPIHHERFDWTTLSAANPDKAAKQSGGVWYKDGDAWGDQEGEKLTRFTLYKDITVTTGREQVPNSRHFVCDKYKWNGKCEYGHYEYDYTYSYGRLASWQGCVESRPYPHNVQDTPATTSDPATLFVPMFAPDEPGDRWETEADTNPEGYGSINNWWNDGIETSDGQSNMRTRQRNMAKYYEVRPYGATTGSGAGPNYSCTTNAITPLTDVTAAAGLTAIKAAIDDMAANGATNVPEGMAWGWRVVSGGAPFTEGRGDAEKGNDKVVIVLTDGENTYYTPGSLGAYDPAGNKSTYSAYGYAGYGYNGTATTRLFMGTTVSQSDYSNGNYTAAMNEHFAALCNNAKASNIIVMTVALDLSTTDTAQKKQIEALKSCSSDSRYRKDAADSSKPAKLFWNTTGGELEKTFKEIADELSNLRIIS